MSSPQTLPDRLRELMGAWKFKLDNGEISGELVREAADRIEALQQMNAVALARIEALHVVVADYMDAAIRVSDSDYACPMLREATKAARALLGSQS